MAPFQLLPGQSALLICLFLWAWLTLSTFLGENLRCAKVSSNIYGLSKCCLVPAWKLWRHKAMCAEPWQPAANIHSCLHGKISRSCRLFACLSNCAPPMIKGWWRLYNLQHFNRRQRASASSWESQTLHSQKLFHWFWKERQILVWVWEQAWLNARIIVSVCQRAPYWFLSLSICIHGSLSG